MTKAQEAAETEKATQEAERYATKHAEEAVALPEAVDAIAEASNTTVWVAKLAVFRIIDRGRAKITPEFKVEFV